MLFLSVIGASLSESHIDGKYGASIVIRSYVSVTAVNDKIWWKSHSSFYVHADTEQRVYYP